MADHLGHLCYREPVEILLLAAIGSNFELNGFQIDADRVRRAILKVDVNRQDTCRDRVRRFAEFILCAVSVGIRIDGDRQTAVLVLRKSGSCRGARRWDRLSEQRVARQKQTDQKSERE